MKLRITADGRIRALWDDSLALPALGVVHVHRASHVEFDDADQNWCVRAASRPGHPDSNGPALSSTAVLHRAATRAAALAWEQQHFGPGGPGWSALSGR